MIDDVLDHLAVTRDRRRTVTELPGGLTNRNYRVTTRDGDYVVRISPAETGELAIDRDHEFRNSRIAAAKGIGAPVVDYLPGKGVLVVGYVDAATWTEADLAANLDRVAAACRKLHAGTRFAGDFDMFATQARYVEIVRRRGFRLPPGYLDFAGDARRIQDVLGVHREPTVACHNDLLAANFLDSGDRLTIIDYEYAGNNDPCFELGNIGREAHLSHAQVADLVTAYYGRRRPSKIARARLFGIMSDYGWTLWASIQDATSAIDFDFWAWGLAKYDAAVAAFRDRDFERLLEAVQGAD